MDIYIYIYILLYNIINYKLSIYLCKTIYPACIYSFIQNNGNDSLSPRVGLREPRDPSARMASVARCSVACHILAGCGVLDGELPSLATAG